ncbi:MAG TPA: MFS transporter [Chloroflexota bacterium]
MTVKSISLPVAARIGDIALMCDIWLLILVQILSTFPASATGIFLPVMAADAGSDMALLGGLRGLGGAAALVCGVLAAPLIDRVARAWAISGGLALVALGALLATFGSIAALMVFFALAGASGAITEPSVQSAAADGRDAETGARAAAMLSAFRALSPMLAAPLLAAPALVWGWRGDFFAMAICCLLVAVVAGATIARQPVAGLSRPGYLTAFRTVGAAAGALPLVIGSTLRATLQFAWLTYLAAYLIERFGATTIDIAVTWTLGGTGFFIANLLVGRWIGAGATSGWRTPERLLPASLVVLVVLTPIGLLVATLPAAMLIAGLTAAAHGAVIAAIISLLVGRYTPIRGAVLGLNAAGSNLGLFVGAAIGGVALAWAGYPGLTLTLGLLVTVTSAVTAWALRLARGPASTLA